MTKTHETKKITFRPTNIEVNYDKAQGIFFVNLETEPFDHEGKFVDTNPKTGKLEEKNEVRKFSRLKFTFNSQKGIDNFSSLVKKGQFYEVETNWSSDVKTGKIGGELKEVIWVKEENPIIKLSAGSKINPSCNPNEESSMSDGTIALIIVGVISVVGFFSWLI